MGDYQINPGQRGAYEVAVPARAAVAFTIAAGPTIASVIHHSGESPIYISVGQAAEPGDPAARMVTQGAWMDVPLDVAHGNTVYVTARADAIVSVALP